MSGSFLFFPQTALAAAPSINHWSVWQADGDASATTTLYAHVSVGDDTATPGGSPALVVAAVYKSPNWAGWASTTCLSEYNTSRFHRCPLPIEGGADARTYKYYIDASDGTEHSYMSWATDTNNIANARNYPAQTTIYNAPSWTSGISAQVMDGRQYAFSQAIAAGTSTIYIASTTNSTNNLAANDWVSLKSSTGQSEPKVQILSVLGFGSAGTQYEVSISGYTLHSFSTSDYVQEFLDGALVWLEGTTLYGTTTAQQATSTFGGLSLSNIPNGTFDAVAFKEGFGEHRINNVYLSGTSTSTINFILSFGGFQGGTNLTGASVNWSAPSDGMMGAPVGIGIGQSPILIAFSGNASSSTITKDNIKLQTATPSGTFADFASYYAVAYEPQNSTVSIGGTDYDFGPDAKAIVYSSTTLATSTGYLVKLNSNVKDANNNAIQGNNPAGGYNLFFSTSGGFFSGGIGAGDYGMGGSFMPPFAMNVMPNSGAVSVPLNTKIAVQFNQAMSATGLANNIELRTLNASYQEGTAVTFTAALSDADKSLLIITPSSNLAASTRYKVKLLGGLQSSSGVTMAPPGSTIKMFEFEFETGSSADSSVPTISATGLDRYLIGASYINVPTASTLKVSFSESIDPTTVNTSNIYLRSKGSNSNLSATVKYDIMEGKALLSPNTALNATTTYILTLTGYIKDFTSSANGLATTTYEFVTGGADVTGPALSFFNADDYSISLTFDEPMNSAKVTDTSTWPSGSTKWATSLLNPANYIAYVDNGPPGTGSVAKYYSVDSLASSSAPSVTLTYDALYKTVDIEGMKLLADPSGVRGGVRIWVKNVTDISGNVIQTNAGPDAEADNFGSNAMGGPVKNSSETFGMMGPGVGMFAPPTSVGSFTMTDFGGKNPALMGMMPVGVWPMNMMAGATSTYFIDIPISSGKAIPASGKIVIGPFPDESVVSLVKNADPNATFAHADINGPGTGTVVLSTAAETSGGASNDGVTVSGQTVTVTLGSIATQGPDFIHLELDNIKNPTTPTQGGYKIAIQSQNSGSTALESFTSMPFFIMPKGKYTIIGHVTTTDVGLNGVQVFGGSPSTGPLFTTSGSNAFGSSTAGEFKIEGLNSGSAMLMTEQSVTVGSDEYMASVPEPIFIDDNTSANTTGAAFG
ncbi:Ig-like domain-containing protein, partial [Candidatus Giovannonibacteria bacterium]|nr:Ig-like domain-containing protein [Candidatus Giovannonibacteria bacterium]